MAAPRRELGIWPLVIGAAIVILLALFIFTRGEVEPPTPLPDSPAATGSAGQPAGTTGDPPQPGAPAGVEPPADSAPVDGTTAPPAPAAD